MKEYTFQNSIYYHELKDLGFSAILIAVICFFASYGETLLHWIKSDTGKLYALFLMAALVIGVIVDIQYLVRSLINTDKSETITNL